MRPEVAARLLIHGRVQGVGFRFFAQGLAGTLGLCGWVRNLPDEDVEVYAEGLRTAIETFVEQLKKGPPMARVKDIRVDWSNAEDRYASFSIIS